MTFRIHKVRMAYQPVEYDEPKDCDSCNRNIPFRLGCHVEADCFEPGDCDICNSPHSETDHCMTCVATIMIEMAAAVGATGDVLLERWRLEVARRN